MRTASVGDGDSTLSTSFPMWRAWAMKRKARTASSRGKERTGGRGRRPSATPAHTSSSNVRTSPGADVREQARLVPYLPAERLHLHRRPEGGAAERQEAPAASYDREACRD